MSEDRNERVQFEAAYRLIKKDYLDDLGYELRRNSLKPDQYYEREVIVAWQLWQIAHKKNESIATTAESLEKAALICDKWANDGELNPMSRYSADKCASEIRALIKEGE